jgi:Na+/melibiose symporter-like transporter
MSSVVHDGASALIATVCGSASVAVADVVVDSIVVERTRAGAEKVALLGGDQSEAYKTSAELQSLCWGASSIGGILAAAFSGSLLEKSSPNAVFQLTALFPLVIAISSLGIEEDRITQSSEKNQLVKEFQTQFSQLKNTLINPEIYLPVLFIFLWRATPTADSASFYFAVNDLGFKPEFLGTAQLAGSVASLAGILLYRWKLKSVPYKSIILWCTVSVFFNYFMLPLFSLIF